MGFSKKSDCQEGGEGGMKNQYIEGNGLKGGRGLDSLQVYDYAHYDNASMSYSDTANIH